MTKKKKEFMKILFNLKTLKIGFLLFQNIQVVAKLIF